MVNKETESSTEYLFTWKKKIVSSCFSDCDFKNKERIMKIIFFFHCYICNK